MSSCSNSEEIYDLIGLGFGPANIAIAGALAERWTENKIDGTDRQIKNVLFLDRHDRFQWHPGMLLPEARMQISFMKDLATLRNPRSPITFMSYLHSQDRLITFINRGSTVPTRKEYADYLLWASHYVQTQGAPAHFGVEINDLKDGQDGTIHVRGKVLATGEETFYRTRNLVISPGGGAKIPRCLEHIFTHPMVLHSSTYTSSIVHVLENLKNAARPLRIGIVGSGQSAAEISIDLRDRLRAIPSGPEGQNHVIDLIIRKGSLKPSDDTPFSNEIFDPAATNTWFNIPSQSSRAAQLREYRATNYGVVNPRTIDQLYEIMYDQKLEEKKYLREKAIGAVAIPTSSPQIHFRAYSNVISADALKPEETQSKFNLILQNIFTDSISSEKYDAVICATGYQRYAWIDMLKNSNLSKHFNLSADTDSAGCLLRPSTDLDRQGEYEAMHGSIHSDLSSPITISESSTAPTSPADSIANLDAPASIYISRNYRLVPIGAPDFKPKVYLQGVEEATHGLSDTLLSVMGVRAGEVVADLCA